MHTLRFIAMPTDEARAFQAGALDANGQVPERAVSDGGGVPCRHCQRNVEAGAAYLILAYRPFPSRQPYAEVGPIFLHAEACERYPETEQPPARLRNAPYLLRGYSPDNRIVYGTGKVTAPDAIEATAEDILARDGVAYVHVRSSTNNCYQLRIERA